MKLMDRFGDVDSLLKQLLLTKRRNIEICIL